MTTLQPRALRVAVRSHVPDTDTPKGTALMSWWPTLEWPDGRQFETRADEGAISRATTSEATHDINAVPFGLGPYVGRSLSHRVRAGI